MDFDLDTEDNELFTDPAYHQMSSALPSTPNSNMSSSPVISDDIILSSQSSLHNVLDHGDSVLGSGMNSESKLHNSRRGPGRPRKDIHILKTPLKRKQIKEMQPCIDRGGVCLMAPSSSESSNTGFPEDKIIQNQEDPPYCIEKYPGKVCCFCNLGERSVLGQGDFLKWEIDSDKCDTLPVSCSEDEKQLLTDNSKSFKLGHNSLRRQKSICKNKSSFPECLNELDQIGRVDVVSLRSLVDGSHIYSHRMCLLWSQGISGKVPELKSTIELVVAKSLSRRCSFCAQYGASVICKMNCINVFHLPCAAASGCFLIMETFTTFCKDHVKQVPLICADMNLSCRRCSKIDEISMMIMCATCGDHYHSTCVALVNIPDTRAGWNCTQCSKCLICREGDGTEGRSIKCEQCQRLYHTSCLRPVISSLPKYGWKCNRCRVCTDCGSRTPGGGTSSRWHCHYTICDSCYQQRNKGFSCPICHKAYRAAAHKEMVKCNLCHRFVHSLCDEEADLNIYHKNKENNPDYDYICPQCKLPPNSEKLQTVSIQMRCLTDVPDLYPLSVHESVLKDRETESFEKGCDDYILSESSRISKKKIILKDFQRSRGGKLAMQRANLLTQIGRKRNVRGKNRQLLLASNPSIAMSSDKGNNHTSDDGSVTEKKMLLCSAKDKFILSQDICVMCGSVGLDKESHLIACAQCGQCYHPYCVNIKLSKVVLQRGWRCLDCTVCEGCGQRNDEARLILCDECDLSYHIYCMSPPLDTVPHGNWKCKWCAACEKCGKYSAVNAQNHNGVLECGTCASQVTCCVCRQQYNENDLIIQCKNCERWLHCECDSIKSEEEAQFCENIDYHCILCRPKGKSLSHFLAQRAHISENNSLNTTGNSLASIKSMSGGDCSNTSSGLNEQNDLAEVTFWMDGVCMSEKGANMIKSLSTEIKRKRKMRITDCQTKESGIIAAIESVVAGSNLNNGVEENGDGESSKKKDEYKDGMIWTHADSSPPQGFSISTNDEGVSILRRKRQRNLQKLGIGGFNVRNRAFKKVNEEPAIANLNSLESEKKKKIIRKKVKSKLSESYPTYLQEAFFGKTLLDMKSNKHLMVYESDSSDELNEIRQSMFCDDKTQETTNVFSLLPAKCTTIQEKRDVLKPNVESVEALSENRIRNILLNKEVNNAENFTLNLENEDKFEKKACKDIGMAVALSSPSVGNLKISQTNIESGACPPLIPEISNEALMCSSDGHIVMENAGLSGNKLLEQEIPIKSEVQSVSKSSFSTPVAKVDSQGDISSISNIQLLQTSSLQKQSQVDFPQSQHNQQCTPKVQNTKECASMQISLHHTTEIVESTIVNEKPIKPQVPQDLFSHQLQKAVNDDMYFNPTPHEEVVEAVVAGTQKTAEKMRRDEDLGEMATISAVLYANTQHPELKQIYPNWNDRCKQILKRWRSLSTEKKAPFLQHAKDNRSALRMRRSQQDQERICLNQKSLKEQEQERIWKQHQAKAKEAQTNIYGNRGIMFDVNMSSESDSVDKHPVMYNVDIIPATPTQNFVAEEVSSTIYNANIESIPVRGNTLLEEHTTDSEKNENPSDNKQLRMLLLKQQALASSWVSESTGIRNNLFQQSYDFKLNVQQNSQKTNLYQCNENKVQLTSPTSRNAAMLQTLDNMQESFGNDNKPNLKCRKDPKVPDTGDTEMEKLDSDENVGFGDILGGLGDGNDDDLLKSLTAEIGDDFNILAYADPELDELASSQNLLNKLDFDYSDRNS